MNEPGRVTGFDSDVADLYLTWSHLIPKHQLRPPLRGSWLQIRLYELCGSAGNPLSRTQTPTEAGGDRRIGVLPKLTIMSLLPLGRYPGFNMALDFHGREP